MELLMTLDSRDYDPAGSRFCRPSVRGILIRDGLVAMAYVSRMGYYKFPGGGMEPGERREDALVREIREETGLVVDQASIRPFGLVHRIIHGDESEIFDQENYYYFCSASGKLSQRLDDYEAQDGFTLRWVRAEEAIAANRANPECPGLYPGSEREARVLELLLARGHV